MMTRPATAVLDLRDFLIGDWRLTRIGWDGPRGQTMRLRGIGRFSPTPDGLLFEEQGTLEIGTHSGEAGRRYVYRFDEPGEAQVCFDDGRSFHRLNLTSGIAEVRHDCAPDLYEGRYRVLGPDRWAVTWRVTGPRKRHLIASRFVRMTTPI